MMSNNCRLLCYLSLFLSVTCALSKSACEKLPTNNACPPVEGLPSCVCQKDNNTYISLLGLSSKPNKPSLLASDGSFNYSYNPCYGINLDVPSGACKKEDKMAGCQQQKLEEKEHAWGLGSIDNETIFEDKDGFFVTYLNGQDSRCIKVNLVCVTSDQPDEFSAEGDKGHALEYVFTLKSHAVCPTNKKPSIKSSKGTGNNVGGIGIGIILLAIAGIVTYFIVGIIINKIKFKKTGTELIPQKTFWFSLPILIKDGALFTISPIICLVKRIGYKSLA